MAENIPQVFFHKPGKNKFEFEVIPLKQLFSRKSSLMQPLEQPHRVEFYQVLYITKGQGRHYIDFKPYDYFQGSLLFISAGQVHAFNIHLQTDGFLLLFTEDFLTKNMIHSDIFSFSRLYNYHLYQPDIPPMNTPETIFNPIVREIYNEYFFEDPFAKEEILRTLLKLLLLKAERIRQKLAPRGKKNESLIRFGQFRHLLSAHFAETRNAEAYAGMMNISYNHLNKIVKAVTGSTAKSFIDSFIILEIKRWLAVSDMPVKELTYRMGFDEPTNFVKYFKKHTQQSPAHFRKTMTG